MIELTIRSANEQKIVNEMIIEQERQLQAKRMECIVQEVFNVIKDTIENSTSNNFSMTLMGTHVMKIFGVERSWQMADDSYDTVEECLPIVQEAFAGFGYKVTFETYSRSWRRKSGKIAFVRVQY